MLYVIILHHVIDDEQNYFTFFIFQIRKSEKNLAFLFLFKSDICQSLAVKKQSEKTSIIVINFNFAIKTTVLTRLEAPQTRVIAPLFTKNLK